MREWVVASLQRVGPDVEASLADGGLVDSVQQAAGSATQARESVGLGA